MSFYENQAKARRKTALLVFYFICAVALIVSAVNLVIYFSLFSGTNVNLSLTEWISHPFCFFTSLITLMIIACGSLFRAFQLQDGGASIALMAGGRHISFDTTDPHEKKLLNIAEEMAIASGTRVPQIYLLEDEQSINAFVAGLTPNTAILAVTKGAMVQLSRDELQGVIGHEFSHLLNGDTRINVKLISILAGILFIGQIGEYLLRSTTRSRRSKEGNYGALLGLGLMAIGYIGLFFGRLIKAAISRQREFLADASAVQFTRNPYGIGGALYKIGYGTQGSLIQNRHAEEMSHLCFSETLKVNFASLLTTHPPIDERLRAIEPSLKTRMRSRQQDIAPENTSQHGVASVSPQENVPLGGSGFSNAQPEFSSAQPPSESTPTAIPPETLQATVKASIGTVTPGQAAYAQELHQGIPDTLQLIAHDPLRADDIIYSLILSAMKSHGKEASTLLKERIGIKRTESTLACYSELLSQPANIRLPLLDTVTATLEVLNTEQKEHIITTTKALIDIDGAFTLNEFVIFFLVEKYLGPSAPQPNQTINTYRKAEKALVTVFTLFVKLASADKQEQQRLLTECLSSFSIDSSQVQLNAPPTVSARTLSDALKTLGRLSPLLKQPVIECCVDCVIHDNIVKPLEAELLRAICEALDCPMPPILPAAPL